MRRAFLLLLALAACGGDPAPRAAAPETTTPPATTPAPSPTVLVERGEVTFSTPSGNIACYLSDSTFGCDIRDHTWRPPPKPADCDLDYGNGLTFFDGHIEFQCAGDTLLGAARVLAYGTTVRVGNNACTSERTGVTCRVGTTGFFLSRTSYRIF